MTVGTFVNDAPAAAAEAVALLSDSNAGTTTSLLPSVSRSSSWYLQAQCTAVQCGLSMTTGVFSAACLLPAVSTACRCPLTSMSTDIIWGDQWDPVSEKR